MKQEFVTSTGIVTLERNVLYVRRKINFIFNRTLFQIILVVSFGLKFIGTFYEEPESKRNFELVLYGVATLIWLTPLVYRLIHKSYANRIAVQGIEYYRTEEDINGLETHVHLVLRFGRVRTLSFRKLENQLEPFLQALASFQVYEEEPQLT